jgi:hypothetical protein
MVLAPAGGIPVRVFLMGMQLMGQEPSYVEQAD